MWYGRAEKFTSTPCRDEGDSHELIWKKRCGVLTERMQKFINMTVNRSPVRRSGVPDDIAAACAYLASEEASFFTGQVMSPNGGMYM